MFEALALAIALAVTLAALAVAFWPRPRQPYAITIAEAHDALRAAQRYPSK